MEDVELMDLCGEAATLRASVKPVHHIAGLPYVVLESYADEAVHLGAAELREWPRHSSPPPSALNRRRMNHGFEDLSETPFELDLTDDNGAPHGCAVFRQTCDGPLHLDAALCRELAEALTQAADVLERGEIAHKEQQLARLDREIQRIAADRDALCREIDQASQRGIVS